MSSALLKDVTFLMDWAGSLCKQSFDSLFSREDQTVKILLGGVLF